MSNNKKAVVIGTGAGGLTAAATLAQSGFEVVALERAKQLGGYLNPFKRRKYHFDPGVHYVGTAWKGGLLNRVLGFGGSSSRIILNSSSNAALRSRW